MPRSLGGTLARTARSTPTRALVRAGATATAVAREHGVSHSTAARWFAEAGLLGSDPKADTHQLVELYVHQRLTTREVAAELGISKDRVIQALTAAGIPRRPQSVRRPRGARAAVTDTALAEVYHRQGMTIAQAATHFGVSDEYVRRRVAEAKVPVRPGGGTRPEAQGPPRTLISDLYADPDIVAALRRHQVEVPDEADWHVTGPFQTYVPLPVPATLLRELYVDIGLSIHHIALLIGLGDLATGNRLTQAGVPLRPGPARCPWNRRRYSGTENGGRARNRAGTTST